MRIIDIYPNLEPQGGEREVGIEIEMEGTNLPTFNMNYWSSTKDGSLRGTSAEYVMNRPCSRKNITSRLRYLARIFQINEATLKPSTRCGVHIHINCQTLSLKETFNFVCLYLILENILVQYCGESRKGNLFCLRARDSEGILEALWEVKRIGDISVINGDKYRYASVNLEALPKYGSVEFRSLQTPQNILDIVTWVQLLLRVKDASLLVKEVRDVIESISVNGRMEFIQSVFQEQTPLIMYDKIEHDLMDGVRRVQDIAYTEWATVSAKKDKLLRNVVVDIPPLVYDQGHIVFLDNNNVMDEDDEPRF